MTKALQWNCALPWPIGSEPMPHNLGSEQPTANITKGKGLLVEGVAGRWSRGCGGLKGNGVWSIDEWGDVVGQQHKQQQQVGYGNPRGDYTRVEGLEWAMQGRHQAPPHPLPNWFIIFNYSAEPLSIHPTIQHLTTQLDLTIHHSTPTTTQSIA